MGNERQIVLDHTLLLLFGHTPSYTCWQARQVGKSPNYQEGPVVPKHGSVYSPPDAAKLVGEDFGSTQGWPNGPATGDDRRREPGIAHRRRTFRASARAAGP